MPFPVISTLVPVNDGYFPVVMAANVGGGYQAVDDQTARLAIPEANQEIGMLVYQRDTSKYYTLTAVGTPGTWTLAQLGGGGGGASSLIYQPGGTDNTSAGVYTSWSALMAARANIKGTVSIVIDDSFTSPAVIPAGTWDLTKNTKLVGNKGPTTLVTQLVIADGATLVNVSEFYYLYITSLNSDITNTVFAIGLDTIGVASQSISFFALNTTFLSSGTGACINGSGAGLIELWGNSSINANTSAGAGLYCNMSVSNTTLNINLHDQSFISGNSDGVLADGGYGLYTNMSGSNTYVYVNLLDSSILYYGASYNTFPGGFGSFGFCYIYISPMASTSIQYGDRAPIFIGGNYTNGWQGSPSGSILVKNDDMTAFWQAPSTPIIASNTYFMYGGGDFFADLTSTAFTVFLTSGATTGEKHTFKDYQGNAATNNLTINGNGAQIEQFTGGTGGSIVLNQNYQKVTLEFNGTFWSIV